MRVILWMAIAPIISFAATLVAQENAGQAPQVNSQPKRPYTISKETTYFTGPLKPDGAIDFIAAVNEHFAKGVTPENNAALIIVPLLPLDRWESAEHRNRVLLAMGLDPANCNGQGAIDVTQFLKGHALGGEQFNTEFKAALSRTWTDDEYPHLVTWLRINESALCAISDAAKLERYYVPLIGDDETGLVMTALLDDAQMFRFVGATFVVRANNHLANRRWDAAWADIVVIQNLARLIAQGQCSVHGGVCGGLSELACDAAKRFISVAGHDNIDWKALSDSWQVAPVHNYRDELGITERAMFVQIICQIWDEPERTPMMTNPKLSETQKPINKLGISTLREMMESKEIDLDEVLRFSNLFYDRGAAVFETKDISGRSAEVKQLEDELHEFQNEAADIFGPTHFRLKSKDSSHAYAKSQLTLLFPVFAVQLDSQRRHEASRHVIEMALAARLLQACTGQLPQSLNELKPLIDDTTTINPLSGDPITFRSTDNGILIYHGNVRGKDDGGDIDGEDPKDWGILIKN